MPVRSRPSPGRAAPRRGGARPDTIIIDGRAYSWRVILELRRAQLAAWEAARPRQPPLFELKEDARPKAERTAAGRYAEPTLLAFLADTDG